MASTPILLHSHGLHRRPPDGMIKITLMEAESIPHYDENGHRYITAWGVGMSRSYDHAMREARRELAADLGRKQDAHFGGMGGVPIMSEKMIERNGKVVARVF